MAEPYPADIPSVLLGVIVGAVSMTACLGAWGLTHWPPTFDPARLALWLGVGLALMFPISFAAAVWAVLRGEGRRGG